MLDEIISYHRYMVELLLFMVVINIVIPPLLKQNIEKMVFWTRIGYFGFWMFWSMTIFTGLIVFMFTGRDLTVSVIAMIIVAVVLGGMDGYRATKNSRLWRKGLDITRFSTTVLLLEIVVIVAMALLAIGSA